MVGDWYVGRQAMLRGKRRSAAVSFVEFCLAFVILVLALMPIVGLRWGGLGTSGDKAGYKKAAALLERVMDNLLSDTFPFDDIPVTRDFSLYKRPEGSVAACSKLDPVFSAENFTVSDRLRYVFKGNTRYNIEMWVADFPGAGDLKFHYCETPMVDYAADSAMLTRLVLNAGDYGKDGYSPYCPDISEARLLRGAPWASKMITVTQGRLSDPARDAVTGFDNFKKIVLRIAWRSGMSPDAEHELWLVSFRARLAE